MSDLTPEELAKVLEAHGHPGQIARGDKMVDYCPHEVQRTRDRQLSLFVEGA